ncbi:CsgG/HfaB family protein [Spirochaetota bacterium]
MRKIAITVLLILLCMPLFAKKMRIAIIDFKAKGIPKSDAVKVSELVRNELINTGKFTVIERAQMKEILKEQGFQQTGCTDVSCAVKVGKLLSAKKILVGTVMKLGRKIIITGRIVDVEKGVAEFSEKGKARSNDDLDIAVENFAAKLSRKIGGGESSHTFYRPSRRKYVPKNKQTYKQTIDHSFYWYITYTYLAPMSSMKDISESGHGFSYVMLWDSVKDFNIGFAFGLYYFLTTGDGETKNLMIMPITVNAGYRFFLFKGFYIMPQAAVGGDFILLREKSPDEIVSDYKYGFEPTVSLGVSIGYFFSDYLFVDLAPNYNVIIEKDGAMQFLSINVGIGMAF